MDYGLWNLHGSLWAGSNPCNGNSVSRSLYSTVGGGPFHGCADNFSFAGSAISPPCRSSYRSQPEYVAMKPSIVTTCGPSGTSPSEERTEQDAVTDIQNDLEVEHSGAESGLSGESSITTNSSPQAAAQVTKTGDFSSPQNHKKMKSPKHQDKDVSAVSKSGSTDSPWNNSKTDNTLQFLNQQYNPIYSMMFGRLPNKSLHAVSDDSDDEDEEDDDDDNDNDGDSYNSHSSLANRSPSGGGRSGYECGECGLVADTRPSLKKHISVCHPAPGSDSNLAHALMGKVSASCPMASCHFHTSERDELEAHVARHVADGYSPTGKKRTGPVSLQRVRYEREEYRCQICTYTCTIEKAFYKHLKLHSLGLSASSVKISCVICGKDRPSEVEMNKHMRRHRDNRYFCCDICVFRTVQLKKLIQHRRMHTGEKPHLCPHCAYRSARRDNLRSHVRRVHKKENLYCDTFSPRGLLHTGTTSPHQEQEEEPEQLSPNSGKD